jgi:trimethylamine--corrinoid protein Co-methyltransferase
MSEETRGRRGGGREGRKATRAAHAEPAAAFLTRTLKPFEILSDEGLEILEHNADTILEEVGVEFRDYPSAIERFRGAGADVDGNRVRFPRGMCRQIVQASAPKIYTQHARTPNEASRSATRTRSSRRTTAARSCGTSTTGAATGRSRTFGTS